MTVAGSVIVDVMRYLLTRGVNAALVLREAGLDPGVVYAPDREISGEEAKAFWHAAAEAAGDPAIGLHVGEATLPSTLGVAGYAIMKSATFGEALRKAMTYIGLVNRGGRAGGKARGALGDTGVHGVRGGFGWKRATLRGGRPGRGHVAFPQRHGQEPRGGGRIVPARRGVGAWLPN